MKTSFPSKPSIWRRLDLGKIAFAIVAVVFTILLVVAVFKDSDNGDQEKGGLKDSAPVPSHSESVHDETNHDDDVEYPNANACENTVGADELSAFRNLVMDYEEAYNSPPSPDSYEKLSELSTNEYQQAHSLSEPEEISDATVELLRDETLPNKTKVTCTVNSDGSRLAASRVWIKTSFINDSGVQEVIFPELGLPLIHYSTWVVSEGQWKVVAED